MENGAWRLWRSRGLGSGCQATRYEMRYQSWRLSVRLGWLRCSRNRTEMTDDGWCQQTSRAWGWSNPRLVLVGQKGLRGSVLKPEMFCKALSWRQQVSHKRAWHPNVWASRGHHKLKGPEQYVGKTKYRKRGTEYLEKMNRRSPRRTEKWRGKQ